MSDSHQHYFTSEPATPNARRTITVDVAGLNFELETSAGVFSANQLDKGTRVLLEQAPPPPAQGTILDLGCGYGPIAMALAMKSDATIWAVDINTRALELTARNATKLNADNVIAATPDDVPADLHFTAIYSNPPIRIGKPALHELLLTWLPRLEVGGDAYMVVQRNLGSDSLEAWLNAEGFPTRRIASKRGFRILHTTHREKPQ